MTDRTVAYEFGSFRLDPLARVLSLRDQPIALAPKSFDLLLLLVEGRGRVLERHELFQQLWPDTTVEEANLTFQVSTLRRALGEEGSKWIETVPKHGYRFTAPVRELRPEKPPATNTQLDAVKPPSRRAGLLIVMVVALAVAVAVASLWRNSPSGRERAAQTATAIPLTAYSGWEGYPTLSPDASQVAFTWNGPSENNSDIYLKLVGPGEPHRLTTDSASDFSPAWSPDGQQIAFLRARPTIAAASISFRRWAERNGGWQKSGSRNSAPRPAVCCPGRPTANGSEPSGDSIQTRPRRSGYFRLKPASDGVSRLTARVRSAISVSPSHQTVVFSPCSGTSHAAWATSTCFR